MQRNPGALALLIASIVGASCLAYAQLGGTGGVQVPYQGRLELDGAPANGLHDFRFSIFNASTGGGACDTHEQAVVVVAGTFSLVLGPVAENCIRGQDVFVGVEVSQDEGNDGYVALPGRQQVLAAPAAATSGSGDFDVQGNLDVGGALNVDGVSTLGTVNAATVSASGLNVSGSVGVGSQLSANSVRIGGTDLAGSVGASVVAQNANGGNGSHFGTHAFTTGGSGRGVLALSASAYRANEGPLRLIVQVDGADVATIAGYTNESASHKTMPTIFVTVTGAPFATHLVQVREGPSTIIDINDFLNIALIEDL